MINKLKSIWLNKADKLTVQRMKELSFDEEMEMFSKMLSFGTAGARARMDIGPSNFNIYTVRQITLSYLDFLKQKYQLYSLKEKGIIIFHDNRQNSQLFAQEAANILSNANILVYIAPGNQLKTTPFLSYCIRALRATGGMNFTASHNPKEYNGCKVYNNNGCQLLPLDTIKIQKFMNDHQEDIFYQKAEGFKKLICEIPEKIEKGFIEVIKQDLQHYNLPKEVNTLFSPQRGTTYRIIPQIFNELGYPIESYAKYSTPDAEFKFLKAINPEDKSSFKKLIEYSLTKNKKINLILVADPDGDRLGIAFKNSSGNFQILHGNETATLLANYLCYKIKQRYQLKHKWIMVTTYVSSDLPGIICNNFGHKEIKTFTGFKWIGDEIENNLPKKRLIFAYEEAIGFLTTPIIREKDSIQTAILFAELTNFYLNQSLTLDQVLDSIYQEYGYYEYNTLSYQTEDHQKIDKLFAMIAQQPINSIGEYKISKKEIIPNKIEKSPIVKLKFEGQSWICIRKSGTEPKLKFYISVTDPDKAIAKLKINSISQAIKNFYTDQ